MYRVNKARMGGMPKCFQLRSRFGHGYRGVALFLAVFMVLQLALPAVGKAAVTVKTPGLERVPALEVAYTLEEAKAKVHSNEIIVRYQGELPQIVWPEEGEDAAAAVARLRQDPNVLYAEPNYELRALLGPVKTTVNTDNYWELFEVQASHGWQLGHDILKLRSGTGESETVKVAVIDGGVDAAHEDLSGRVLPGVNVISGGQDSDATVDDTVYGQGTMVAGIIAAVPNNDLGITGAAGDFPIRILPVKALDANGVGSVFEVAHGIRLAADQGARVINLSLGARLPEIPQTLVEAVAYAQQQGTVVVAAAGEDGGEVSGFYPAAIPGVISVGLLPSSDSNILPNTGASLEAYGKEVTGTLPGNLYGYTYGSDSESKTGSAVVVPFVSAAAALIFSVFPDFSSTDVEQALLSGTWPRNYGYEGYGFSIFQSLFVASRPPRVETERVNLSSFGEEANEDSSEPAVSADGRYVAFESKAFNLVLDDYNNRGDIFVYDRLTAETVRVSLTGDKQELNRDSRHPAISADGRYVVFTSYATNIVGDGNYQNVYLHDRDTDGNGVFDETSGISTYLVSTGLDGSPNGNSDQPAIIGDGRYVAFSSNASNLVENDGNSTSDIFVFDQYTGITELISVDSQGHPGNQWSDYPALSYDGRYVAFRSSANNLVAGDTNGKRDIFVHDRETKNTVRVSVSSEGQEANDDSFISSISSDGRFVAFSSRADTLVDGDNNGYDDIFIHDRDLDGDGNFDLGSPQDRVATSRVSIAKDGGEANQSSYRPSISGDGRYVAFESEASNLVLGDINESFDIFVYDRVKGQTIRASMSTSGEQGLDHTWEPVISADGRYVTFTGSDNAIQGALNHDDSEDDIYITQLSLPDQAAPSWPGNKAITASDVGFDSLTLTWTPATDDVGVAGYAVYLENVLLATVTGNVYQVTGLAPGTQYTFKVEAGDAAGNWSTGGPSLTVTTSLPPDPSTAFVYWRAEGGLPGRPLPAGADMNIFLTAETNSQALAEVTYQSWHNPGGGLPETLQTGTATVVLAEDEARPGTYQGTFHLFPGLAEVSSIQVVIRDDAGRETGRLLAGSLPRAVGGQILVDVELPVDASLTGARLVAWSEEAGHGAATAVTTGGIYQLDQLSPAGDYSVQLLGGDGQTLASQADVAVLAGRETSLGVAPLLPASLRVRVVGPTGEGIPGVRVALIDGGTNRFLKQTWTDGQGWLPPTSGLFQDQFIQAVFRIPDYQTYQNPGPEGFVLSPGSNEPTVQVVPLPEGILTGLVTTPGPESQPLAGARVTATQRIDGRIFNRSTLTGSDGRYTMALLAGNAQVEVSSPVPRYVGPQTRTVTIPAGSETTLNLAMSSLGQATVNVAVYTKTFGQHGFNPIPMDWRTAIHYHLEVIDGKGKSYGGYPVQFRARPGDQVQVSVNGWEAGLPADSQTVTLDENRNATAVFYLEEQGGQVQAQLLDDQGNQVNIDWVARIYQVTGGGRVLVRSSHGSGGSFDFRAPQEGTYQLELQEVLPPQHPEGMRPRSASSQVLVNNGDTKALEIQFRSAGAFEGRPGQEVTVTPAAVVPGGVATFRAKYSYVYSSDDYHNVPGQGRDFRNLRLHLDIPAGTELMPGSVTVDGPYEVLTATPTPVGLPYQGGSVTGSVYEMPLGDLSWSDQVLPGNFHNGFTGSVRYQVYLPPDLSQPVVGSTARILWDYQDDGEVLKTHEELLGSALLQVERITLAVPARLAQLSTVASGRAPSGSQVRVYDGDLLLGVAQASPGGFWILPVTLPDWGSPSYHRLRAQIEDGAVPLVSQPVTVLYDTSQPVLSQFSMQQQDGRLVSFDPSAGVERFPYVFVPGMPMTFNLQFTHPDLVSDVQVSLGEEQATTTAGDDGIFTATMTPAGDMGPLKVNFKARPNTALYHKPATTEPEFRKRVPPEMSDFVLVSKTDATPGNPTGQVKFTLPNRPGLTATVDLTARKVAGYSPSPEDEAQAQATGIPVYGLDINIPEVTTSTGEVIIDMLGYIPESAITTEGGAVNSLLTAALARTSGEGAVPGSGAKFRVMSLPSEVVVQVTARITLRLSGNELLNAYDWSKTLQDGFGVPDTFGQIEQLMDQAAVDCSPGAGQAYLAQLERTGNRVMMQEVVKWGMQLAGVFLAPATFGLGSIALFGASQVIQAAMDKSVSDSINLIRNQMASNSNCSGNSNLNPPNQNQVADPVWIYDPSGYVYEAVPDNRLEGVTATALQQDPDTGNWNVWDAEWYGQENPQFSDPQGRYGWDVPQGLWQVMYQKDGYETGWSETMTVPPPRTEVNTGMVSLAPPVVTAVTPVTKDDGSSFILVTFDKYMRVSTLTSGTLSVLTEDGGEEPLTGSLEPVNPVTGAGGVSLARVFRFTPTVPFVVGGTYTVAISQLVQSYAERLMADDYSTDLTIPAADTVPPAVSGQAPAHGSTVTVTRPVIGATASDASGIDAAGITLRVDDSVVSHTFDIDTGEIRYIPGSSLAQGTHTVSLSVADTAGNLTDISWSFDVIIPAGDTVPPSISGQAPAHGSTVAVIRPVIGATVSDASGIDAASIILRVDDSVVSHTFDIDTGEINYLPGSDLAEGSHTVSLVVADTAGNPAQVSWSFSISTQQSTNDGGGGSSSSVPGEVCLKVGDTGGKYTAFGGAIALDIPAGTFPKGTILTIRQLTGTINAGAAELLPVSPVYEIDTGGVVPQQPVAVTVRYDSSALTGIDPRKLGLYRQDDQDASRWVYKDGVIDSVSGTLLARLKGFSRYAVMAYNRTFADLDNHWSRVDVEVLASRHLVQGVGEGLFQPNRAITRAEFAKLLVEMLARDPDRTVNLTSPVVPTFADVGPGAWYYAYVETAASQGLVRGSAGRFRPGDPVTRQEMAAMLVRAMGLEAEATASAGEALHYDDTAQVAPWSRGYVAIARKHDLMRGTTPTTFEPKATATRGQAAVVILRAMERLGLITAGSSQPL